jgi:hypothetical protein
MTLRSSKSDQIMVSGGMTHHWMYALIIHLKVSLQQLYTKWMASRDQPLTPTGKIKQCEIQVLYKWIKCTCDWMPKHLAIKSFMEF